MRLGRHRWRADVLGNHAKRVLSLGDENPLPRLNVLTAFAAAEAYWNPDQDAEDLLRKFSAYGFGCPAVASEVFPSVALVGQPNWKVFHERMTHAREILRNARMPKLCKLFVTPDAESYRQSLLYYSN